MGYSEQILQRKREIEDGLLALMETTPYENITIKGLAEHLHIVRKTFYHYFPSKQACLESLTDRLIYECNLYVMQTVAKDAKLYDTYAARIHFWMEQRAFLDMINQNNLGAFLLDRFLQYLSKEDKDVQEKLSTPHMEYDGDILFFFMSGQLFLLLKWCHEGFPLSLEEMVQKTLRLIHEPLLPPEQEGSR